MKNSHPLSGSLSVAKVFALVLAASALALFGIQFASAAVPTTPYENGFESDTDGWFGDIDRVSSGTDGIAAADGDFYAQAEEGIFTGWDHDDLDASVFPDGGYTTEIDVYLDMAKADGESSQNFEWDSALNGIDGDFLEEAFFDVRTSSDTAGEWEVSLRIVGPDGFEKQDFVDITETGWYTFQHHFYEGDDGLLYIDLAVLNADGDVVTAHTYGGYDEYVVDENVGGSRYGWFSNIDFDYVAIDNAELYLGGPVSDPEAKAECKKGGYEAFGFKNQGQCIRFVNTGKDSR